MTKLRIVTFKIDDELLELLDVVCQVKKYTQSQGIREAIEEWIIKNTVKKRREPRILVIG